LVPAEWWRILARTGAILSLIMLVLYLHPFYGIGFGANILLLIVLLSEQSPILERLSP
jgi:hypothetical protein